MVLSRETLSQSKCLRDYVQITKDIAVKARKVRQEAEVQTELTLISTARHHNLVATALPDQHFQASGSPLLAFLNSHPYPPPAKCIRAWDEVFKVSEAVLSSENTSLSGLDEVHDPLRTYRCHSALLFTFLSKWPEERNVAAGHLYAYLNVMATRSCRLW